MQDCQVPRCNRNKSGDCGLPNPWHIFQKLGLGKGMTKAQRKKAYNDFKNKILQTTGRDNAAFRAELCRMMAGNRASSVVVASSATKTNRNTIVHVHQACDIPQEGLLRQCLSLEEAQSYAFEKALGVGLNGFVFACIYKKRERRVVKMVMVGDPYDPRIELDSSHSLQKVSERSLRREWQMHKTLMLAASPEFRVLNMYGDPCVFKPLRYPERVGTYIMQELPFPTLYAFLKTSKVPPSHWMKKIEVIPTIIAAIHRLGMAHSDLHVGNIAFDPNPSSRDPPYVIDFGRTLVLESALPNKKDRSRFRVIEYTIPLDIICIMKNPPRGKAKMYNAYLEGLNAIKHQMAEDLPMFNAKTITLLKELFTPLPTSSLVSEEERGGMIDRREHLCGLLLNATLLRSGKQSYLDVAGGSD